MDRRTGAKTDVIATKKQYQGMAHVIYYRVPTHNGKTGKPGKMREVFRVREFKISPKSHLKVREFCMSQGKVREN